MQPQLLATKEAAQILGVSVAFLERDRWAGARVPFIKTAAGQFAIAIANCSPILIRVRFIPPASTEVSYAHVSTMQRKIAHT